MVYGGAVGTGTSLPAYDLAIMTAMGMLSIDIGIYMLEKYGLIDKDAGDNRRKRITQHRIYEDLGGSYQAQEDLLKPVIEYLDNFDEFSRHDIYQFFKIVERNTYGWFKEWSLGREYLKKDFDLLYEKYNIDSNTLYSEIEPLIDEIEPYYAGISRSNWLDLYSKSDRLGTTIGEKNSLLGKVLIGQRKAREVLLKIGLELGFTKLEELKLYLLKQRAEKFLSQRFVLDKETGEKKILHPHNFFDVICEYVEGFNPGRFQIAKTLFEIGIFEMSIEEIWKIYSF
jgi:hypothetical protein